MGSAPSGRVLLAHFCRPGENHWYGGRRTLTVGNTEVLAQMIGDRIDCDIYRIDATNLYPDGYDDTVARNVQEQHDDARPEIANPLPNLTGGKTVHPITTHAMSGLGRAPEIYATAAPNAVLATGFAIQGEQVADARDEVARWAGSIRP